MVSFEKLISIITLNKKLYIYSYFFYFCFIARIFQVSRIDRVLWHYDK